MHKINPHQHGMAPESAFRRLMASKDIPGDGVQPHSKGELYPCVISTVESYADLGEKENARVSLEARLRYRAHRLTLDGHSEDYASYEDAEWAARQLLAKPSLRKVWASLRDAAH